MLALLDQHVLLPVFVTTQSHRSARTCPQMIKGASALTGTWCGGACGGATGTTRWRGWGCGPSGTTTSLQAASGSTTPEL